MRGPRFPAAVGIATLILACSGETSAPPMNVVLVVIDTLRADRVSSYGYERPTTPHLDGLARRGVRFANAASTSSWTVPAHASLFTGLFPIQHGATQEHPRLDEGPDTLAEILAGRGYATLAVSANPLVGVRTGLDRGFEKLIETWRLPKKQPPPERHPNLLAAETLLKDLDDERPFLLFVNYIEPHGRYDPPEPYRSQFLREKHRARAERLVQPKSAVYYTNPGSISEAGFQVLRDLYDGEVAYADALVGALVASLEAEGHLENTLLVVTSDHGENIGEHGHYRHVFSLYNTTARVPLIIVHPGSLRAGTVREERVDLRDVFATILAATMGPRSTSDPRGIDLLGDLAPIADRPLIAEQFFPLHALRRFSPEQITAQRAVLAPHLRRLRSIEDRGLRLIWSSDGQHELYDLSSDPGEKTDRYDDPTLAQPRRALAQRLDDFVAQSGGSKPLPEVGAPTPEVDPVDPQTRAELRELGYLH